MLSFLGSGALAGAVLLCFGAVAQARVVGLVVDDSTSMSPHFLKASFAAQIVVAALGESDRLFVARLNGGDGRIQEVPPGQRDNFLRRMRDEWQAKGTTPYEPLGRMLETLVASTGPDDDAGLLVISDGAFSDDTTPDDLSRDYQALRSRFAGRNFQVFFVSLPGQSAAVDVRGKLLQTFNGSPAAGATEIASPADIVPGLRDVVSVLVGADPVDPGRHLPQDGTTVRFSLPFGIRRIVLLTSGDQRQPAARWQSSSFELAAEPLQFEPGMRSADQGEDRRLTGRIVHLLPATPLTARTDHAITLDRPLGTSDRVMFVSDLDIALVVDDEGGGPLRRDANGRLRAPQGKPVRVQAWLTDLVDGRREPLDLSGAGIAPNFTLNDGLTSRDMTFDEPSQRARADAGPYLQPGQYSLSVVARLEGLSYVRSEDLILQVDPVVAVSPALTGRHLMACPDCPAGRVDVMLGDGGPVRDLYAIEAAVPDAPGGGRYRLALEGRLPTGVELVGADGSPVLNKGGEVDVTLVPNKPLPLLLRYDDDYREEKPSRLVLSLVAAQEGLTGRGELALELVPTIAAMRLVEDGHTLPDPSAPFSQPVTEVGDGNGLYVAAEGLRAPLSREHLRVTSPTGLPLSFEAVDDRRILIRPRKRFWCDCVTPSGRQEIVVDYQNPRSGQRDDLSLMVMIEPVPWWQRCWQEMALLLALLGLLLKLLCLARTEHFPARSQLWRCEIGGASVPRRRRLHRRWRRWLWLGCSDEQRRELGLVLAARPSGIALLRGSALSEVAYRTGDGTRLHDLFEANPQRREINLRWNEEIRDEQNGYRYLFVMDRSKQSDRTCD